MQAGSTCRARMREKTPFASPQSAGTLSSAPGITRKTPGVGFSPVDLLNLQELLCRSCWDALALSCHLSGFIFVFLYWSRVFRQSFALHSQPADPNKIHIRGRSSLEGYFDSELPFGS